MNKFILYYESDRFEGSWTYIVPVQSKLNLNELEELIIKCNKSTKDYKKLIQELPFFIEKKDILQIEILTLEDWLIRDSIFIN